MLFWLTWESLGKEGVFYFTNKLKNCSPYITIHLSFDDFGSGLADEDVGLLLGTCIKVVYSIRLLWSWLYTFFTYHFISWPNPLVESTSSQELSNMQTQNTKTCSEEWISENFKLTCGPVINLDAPFTACCWGFWFLCGACCCCSNSCCWRAIASCKSELPANNQHKLVLSPSRYIHYYQIKVAKLSISTLKHPES